MEKLNALLTKANALEASDVHMVAGSAPIFRINGKLTPEKEGRLMPDDTIEMARAILTDKLWDELQEKREVDLSYGIPGVSRFRVNIFHQRSAVSLAFRVIPRDIPSIDSLGIPKKLKELVKKTHGLILVTGPTGSGKSTSLASMIDYMNKEMNRHIITLEDPIEYLHSHNQSIIEQREIGFDTLSFKDGLRASLRQDPDVILVGELRDLDTIQTAITAAETGHLVLGTLHTQDTTGTIDRIIDVFPVHQKNQVRTMLANVLLGVLSQRLFPTLNLPGRVAATELLINNAAIKNLIRNEKMHQIPNVLQTSKDQGMHTMEMSMKQLIAEKQISEMELLPYISGK
ncbi:type IV pilus twitching motility protein PilT [Alkalibacterium olivapovliticus]|uniref:Twitching motility protein PilT n=1 Tax=Alkalibacterium olivapovliticus TaxID=99907 RepID=A0A2T0W943_9LACT|nr:type IV pilus twitching motility protein PilT [Alkalibacterium olivapovliticus]PRY83232.1 twitching motility protein PilT [Alkalibacterium olivapovliticus]